MFEMIANPRARTTAFAVGVIALAACGGRGMTPQASISSATARTSLNASVNAPHYTVTDLGTLGGGFSAGRALNDSGSVTGLSRTGDDFTCCETFLWIRGVIHSLGKDGGIATTTNEDHGINNRDQIVGSLEPRVVDPDQEHFCGQVEPDVCLPFAWRNGAFTVLPILDGHNANAVAINSSGVIVGAAEGARDTSCPPPQVYHFAAVRWSASGAISVLRPAEGDPDAQPAAINDRGDAAGASGSCTAGAIRAVVWRNGTPTVLPGLGGVFNIAFSINNKGDAAGQADLPGDATHHAVLWHNGAVTDLGTINGLPVSLANAMNDHDQIVGFSQNQDNSDTTAELWQDGRTWDLNNLIPPDSGLFLVEALDINNRGQITGYAVTQSQETHGFLLTPSRGNASPSRGAATRNIVLSPSAQAMVRQYTQNRFWHRYARDAGSK
jgi:probable HAF family extracellular repeat protein